MEHTEISKQLSGLYHITLENSLNTLNAFQDYTEKVVNISLEQSPWIPEESRKFILSWVKAYRKGYDDFKVAATEQYKHVDSLLSMGNMAESIVSGGRTKK